MLYLHTENKHPTICYTVTLLTRPVSKTLQTVMATGKDSWGLEESECHSYLEEGQEEGTVELQAGQPHPNLWACDGANNPGNHSQTLLKHEGNWEQQVWTYEWEITPDQIISLLLPA